MKLQTHVKLFLKEVITNWRYIDTILFMALLVIYVGFTDPCDRCIIKTEGNERTCKEAYYLSIGYEETEYGLQKINESKVLDQLKNVTNITIMPIS